MLNWFQPLVAESRIEAFCLVIFGISRFFSLALLPGAFAISQWAAARWYPRFSSVTCRDSVAAVGLDPDIPVFSDQHCGLRWLDSASFCALLCKKVQKKKKPSLLQTERGRQAFVEAWASGKPPENRPAETVAFEEEGQKTSRAGFRCR